MKTNIEQTIKQLQNNTRDFGAKLVDVEAALKCDAQDASAEDLMQAGLTSDEADAVLFILTETGKNDLADSTIHWLNFGW